MVKMISIDTGMVVVIFIRQVYVKYSGNQIFTQTQPQAKMKTLKNVTWIEMNHENKKKTDECTNIFSLMYMVLVFGLLFYVKNDWCDLLFKNFTVGANFKIVILKVAIFKIVKDKKFLV